MQTTTRPTRILMDEHEVILDALACLERLAQRTSEGAAIDDSAARRILEVLGTFADRCHHGKEEGALFPMLVRRGMPEKVGPLAVMLAEHVTGRAEIAGMRGALAAGGADGARRFAGHARAYVDLLRDHIAKENGVLFPMADGILSEAEQAEVLERFRAVESEDIGTGVHEHCIALVRELAAELGVTLGDRTTAHGSSCCGHGGCD